MRHPRLIAYLLYIILSCALIEGALQLFDPWHTRALATDIDTLIALMRAHPPRQYVMTPGVHTFSNWTMTVNADGTRFVPDTTDADCVVAFIGDSVTMGYGVNDVETWVNLIARRFPAVQVVNAGVAGYNARQVATTFHETRASGFFYALINNDAEPQPPFPQPTRTRPLYEAMLPRYLTLLEARQWGAVTPDYALFDEAIEAMRGRVTIVGFGDDPLTARVGVPAVPYWTQAISPADSHANAAGNVQIADNLYTYVERLISDVCPT